MGINTFTAILFFVCTFLIWILYILLRDKSENKKEKKQAQKETERLQKTYEAKKQEQKENEKLKQEMQNHDDNSFNASLELLHKYSQKDK